MSEKYVLFNGKLFAAFSKSGKTITEEKVKKRMPLTHHKMREKRGEIHQ